MAEKTWLTSGEASQLMSEVNGREIGAAYVRLLGRKGLIRTRQLDLRTNLYSRADCARYIVTEKPKTRAVRVRKTGGKVGRPRKGAQEQETGEKQPKTERAA